MKKLFAIYILFLVVLNTCSQNNENDIFSFEKPNGYLLEEIEQNKTYILKKNNADTSVLIKYSNQATLYELYKPYFVPNRSKEMIVKNNGIEYMQQHGVDFQGRSVVVYKYSNGIKNLIILYYKKEISHDDFQSFFKSIKLKFE